MNQILEQESDYSEDGYEQVNVVTYCSNEATAEKRTASRKKYKSLPYYEGTVNVKMMRLVFDVGRQSR